MPHPVRRETFAVVGCQAICFAADDCSATHAARASSCASRLWTAVERPIDTPIFCSRSSRFCLLLLSERSQLQVKLTQEFRRGYVLLVAVGYTRVHGYPTDTHHGIVHIQVYKSVTTTTSAK